MGFSFWLPRHRLKGCHCAVGVDRIRMKLVLRKALAAAGDIVLLFAYDSEALTQPYLA